MTQPSAAAAAAPTGDPAAPDDTPPSGLTGAEARRRLEKSGPNAMPDTTLHPLRRALAKLWAPVPWMLEAAILLENARLIVSHIVLATLGALKMRYPKMDATHRQELLAIRERLLE